MPVVKIFSRLELEQKVLFLDGHWIKNYCVTQSIIKQRINKSLCIKFLQIFYGFAHTNVGNG